MRLVKQISYREYFDEPQCLDNDRVRKNITPEQKKEIMTAGKDIARHIRSRLENDVLSGMIILHNKYSTKLASPASIYIERTKAANRFIDPSLRYDTTAPEHPVDKTYSLTWEQKSGSHLFPYSYCIELEVLKKEAAILFN